jgi:hypothetical protein
MIGLTAGLLEETDKTTHDQEDTETSEHADGECIGVAVEPSVEVDRRGR